MKMYSFQNNKTIRIIMWSGQQSICTILVEKLLTHAKRRGKKQVNTKKDSVSKSNKILDESTDTISKEIRS
jgi:hypothetical protein